MIGNAVHPSYYPITDSWLLAAVRERYNIARKYILYFGGFDLRKNVQRIIRSYAALPAPLRAEYQLVIAGRLHLLGHPLYPDPRPLVRELDMGDRIIFTGQIREQDKAPLYSGATAFLFPSLYEGFGIPVLEAMACGAPVITSRVSALPEVVGDAGVLIDPYSEPAISEALGELLTSPKRRQELGQRARDRSRVFSWRQVAEQTVAVYEEVRAREIAGRARTLAPSERAREQIPAGATAPSLSGRGQDERPALLASSQAHQRLPRATPVGDDHRDRHRLIG